MLKPIGLTEGHYECRSLDETLPIFSELLAAEVVERLLEKKIVGSTTPYLISYARLACSILNTPQEVEKTLAAVRTLA